MRVEEVSKPGAPEIGAVEEWMGPRRRVPLDVIDVGVDPLPMPSAPELEDAKMSLARSGAVPEAEPDEGAAAPAEKPDDDAAEDEPNGVA